MPFERGLPRHEAEAEPVVDHDEAAGREVHTLTVDAGDGLAFIDRSMCKPALRCDSRCDRIHLTLAKRVKQIAGEDDVLALPARKPFADQMIDPRVERPAHLATEAALRQRCSLARDELVVEPG